MEIDVSLNLFHHSRASPDETPRPEDEFALRKRSLWDLRMQISEIILPSNQERGRTVAANLIIDSPGENIFSQYRASILETRCNQEVAVYFGEFDGNIIIVAGSSSFVRSEN